MRQIISPYFAEDPDTSWLDKIHAKQALIYLPTLDINGELTALCSVEFYNRAKEKAQMKWSGLAESLLKKIDEEGQRILHAKIFVIVDMNGNQWVFAGSVNFSRKAFYENFEAGFLFRCPEELDLLKILTDDPVKFDDRQMLPEQPPHGDNSDGQACGPELLFDWKKPTKLSVRPSPSKKGVLSSQTGELLLNLDPSTSDYHISEPSPLLSHLEQHDFVIYDDGECHKNIYVMQTNWVYKPYQYSDLNPKEILDIYASMHVEKRDRYLLTAIIRGFGEKVTEYSNSIDEIRQDPDFFSAYAELFYAFRQLKERCEKERGAKDYYLLSPKPDSLPSLMKQTAEDEGMDTTMKYIIFLSCRELYRHNNEDFSKYEKELNDIRSGFDDSKFITWFEREFDREYRFQGGRNEQ